MNLKDFDFIIAKEFPEKVTTEGGHEVTILDFHRRCTNGFSIIAKVYFKKSDTDYIIYYNQQGYPDNREGIFHTDMILKLKTETKVRYVALFKTHDGDIKCGHHTWFNKEYVDPSIEGFVCSYFGIGTLTYED